MGELLEEEFLKKLGSRIKEIRKTQGLSFNKLSADHGYEKSSLSKLEAGKANATIKTLFRLSVALNVSVDQFFLSKKKA
jgi:transcriptional regulator with XRE-family HTH domain